MSYGRRKGKWRAFNKALHPVRWLDANSTQGVVENPCGMQPLYIACEPLAAGPVELLVGDLDWDWSDASEVRIDRIVGTMSWVYKSSGSAFTDPALPLAMRFGILATEDTDRVYQTIDLFDPESLEEFSWMWLEHRTALGTENQFFDDTGVPQYIYHSGAIDIPLDIRTRRKLGKKDAIVLYAQTKLIAPNPANYTVTSNLTWLLRSIVRS